MKMPLKREHFSTGRGGKRTFKYQLRVVAFQVLSPLRIQVVLYWKRAATSRTTGEGVVVFWLDLSC